MIKNTIALAVATLGSLAWAPAAADAHASRECARYEFLVLKEAGHWQDYIAAGSYAELGDTDFIALESASNEERTCVFGFSLAELSETRSLNAETSFVCFRTGEFELRPLKEYCAPGEAACEIDPAQISIGIGNIEIVEPTIETLGLDLKDAPSVFGRYPSRVSVKVIPEATPSTEGLPFPSRPLQPGLPWTSVPKTLEGIRWGN